MRKKGYSEQIQTINKLIWFVTIISFQLIIPCWTDEEPNIDSSGWIVADATKNDWPLVDHSDGEFYIYNKLFDNDELTLNTNLMPFDEKQSNCSISFNYWKPDNDFRWQYKGNSNEKRIELENKNEFSSTKWERLSADQWKNLILLAKDTKAKIFFKDIDVIYKQKIDLPKKDHQNPNENFKDFIDGFKKNNENSFEYEGSVNKSTLHHIISNNDFGTTCIQIKPADQKKNLSKQKVKISITFANETDAVELPLIVPNFCLGHYLALHPNGPTMITINVEPGENKFTVGFSTDGNQNIKPKVPENKIDDHWIFNHPLFDYNIKLEKKPDDTIEFFACDVMANCFPYVTKDELFYELESFSRNALSHSPIIKRYATKTPVYEKETETTEEKTLKNIKKTMEPNNADINGHEMTIHEVNETLIVPYIDLRAYSSASLLPSSEDDSIILKNVTILKGKENVGTIQFNSDLYYLNGFSDLLQPRWSDLFKDYFLEFNFEPSKKFKDLTLTLGDPSTTMKKTSNQEIKNVVGFTEWVEAPYENKEKDLSLKIESESTNCDESFVSATIQIIFYNGKILEQSPITLKKTEKSCNYVIDLKKEKIIGPFKIFYKFKNPTHDEKLCVLSVDKISPDKNPVSPNSPTYSWFDKELDNLYDCPVNFEFDKSTNRCWLQTIYHDVHVNCNSTVGCSNILDRKLFRMDLYRTIDGTFDSINGIKKFYFPTTMNKNKIQIKKNGDQKDDFCISFNYFGNGTRIFISHDQSNSLYSPLWFNSKIEPEHQNMFSSWQNLPSFICASHLSANPEEVKTIFVWFEQSEQDEGLKYIADFNAHYQNRNANSPLNSFNLDDLKNDYFIPHEEFIQIDDNSLELLLSPTDVNGTSNYEIQLTSQFIYLNQLTSADTFDIDLAFRSIAGNLTHNGGDVFIEFRPFSEDPKRISIAEFKENEVKSIIYKRINRSVDKFQIQFVFTMDKPKQKTDLQFTLNGIALNDPCIDKNINDIFCNQNNGLGECKRFFAPQPFHRCICQNYTSGNECEQIDYCMRDHGSEYCIHNNLGLCENSEADYECSCQPGLRWVRSMRWCLAPFEKDCPENEHLAYTHENGSTCMCDENFVRINNSCVKYDICDPNHRQERGVTPIKPCTDDLANCQRISNQKYHCICPLNLYNVKGIFNSKAQCSDRFCDLNMECDQKCNFTKTTGQHNCTCFNDLYEMDSDNKCQIKSKFEKKLSKCLPDDSKILKKFEMPYIDKNDKCNCKLGYNYSETSKKCVGNDHDEIHEKLGCKSFSLDDDGKFECQCPEGQQFDHQYGKCRWNPCPPNMIKYASNQSDKNNFKCISPCDSKLVRSCSASGGPFYECNSIKAIRSLKIHNGNWDIDEPFVQGFHKKIIDTSNYCQCIFGLQTNSEGQCAPDSSNYYYTIAMDFKKLTSKNLTEIYFDEILENLFDEKKLKFYDITCTENEDDSFKCAATLLIPENIDIKLDEIKKKLKSYCISKDQLFLNSSNDSCVYLWKKTKNEGYQITIERKINSIISIDTYDICQSKPCALFPNSNCKSSKDSFDFDCKCSDYYKRDEDFPTPSMDKYHACKLKSCQDLEYHCQDPKAKCLMLDGQNPNDIEQILQAKLTFDSSIIFNNNGDQQSPMPFCLCSNGYLLNKLNSSCDDHCQKQCNNGDCFYTMSQKQETCICNDEWMGEQCDVKKSDVKKSDDDNNNNGYKVSTIILAILTALLIIGVIFLFMRSRRS